MESLVNKLKNSYSFKPKEEEKTNTTRSPYIHNGSTLKIPGSRVILYLLNLFPIFDPILGPFSLSELWNNQ